MYFEFIALNENVFRNGKVYFNTHTLNHTSDSQVNYNNIIIFLIKNKINIIKIIIYLCVECIYFIVG